ncbi:type II secretion system protein [Deinococcus koreensis]|uniref:type II secretion system protein n=1 Tax=Deinococcus koreensis TaxID=2054903 RepID=UPI001FAFA2F4|nr:type II secretion system protein [Deinococcus koreensis]
MHTPFQSTAGFTLIELLIVIAIIGILVAALIPNIFNARQRALDTAARAYARQMNTWATSWLSGDQTRKVSNLPSSCTDQIYANEGGSLELPKNVSSCLVNVKSDGTFDVQVTLYDGRMFISSL